MKTIISLKKSDLLLLLFPFCILIRSTSTLTKLIEHTLWRYFSQPLLSQRISVHQHISQQLRNMQTLLRQSNILTRSLAICIRLLITEMKESFSLKKFCCGNQSNNSFLKLQAIIGLLVRSERINNIRMREVFVQNCAAYVLSSEKLKLFLTSLEIQFNTLRQLTGIRRHMPGIISPAMLSACYYYEQ